MHIYTYMSTFPVQNSHNRYIFFKSIAFIQTKPSRRQSEEKKQRKPKTSFACAVTKFLLIYFYIYIFCMQKYTIFVQNTQKSTHLQSSFAHTFQIAISLWICDRKILFYVFLIPSR